MTPTTNSYSIISLWRDTTKVLALPRYSIGNNPVFQELPTLSVYFTPAGKKIFVDLRRGKGYTNEIENLNRDDSDLTVTIKLTAAAPKKKNETSRNGILPRRVLILNV